MKECKKYGIKPAKTPQKHALLAGVVLVLDREGKGYSYIHFSEAFVDAVGKELPQGLSSSNPAYIKAMYMSNLNVWRVFAMYLNGNTGVLLWESAERPLWIAKVRRTNETLTPCSQ